MSKSLLDRFPALAYEGVRRSAQMTVLRIPPGENGSFRFTLWRDGRITRCGQPIHVQVSGVIASQITRIITEEPGDHVVLEVTRDWDRQPRTEVRRVKSE